MQNLSTQDSIKTRQLLADRFWIIEQNGVRIGTIQRHDDNNFIVTVKPLLSRLLLSKHLPQPGSYYYADLAQIVGNAVLS